jgi:chemotaxis protein MotB
MSARHRRSSHGGGHEEHNGERWLLTYADMITLLLALFVVLFALSTISAKKFLELKMGLTKTFSQSAVTKNGSNGLLNQTSLESHAGITQSTVVITPPSPASPSPPTPSQIAQQVQQALDQAGLASAAGVSTDTKGVVVRILADKTFFATGSAQLGDVGDQVVDTIAGVVRNDPNDIVVEGYTDNQPISGGLFSSNWQLSAVRAANVVQRLSTVDGVPEDRLQADGFGETQPAVPNTSPQNQAQNRRVDVVILAAGQVGP